MNDTPRLFLGLSGAAASWITLERGAVLAALLASLCTAAFMALSTLEKWRALRVARAAEARAQEDAAQLKLPLR